MKQRFFLKIDTGYNEQYARKAGSIISKFGGGEICPLEGVDKGVIMFVGVDLDLVDLCNVLRKKVGPTDIMSVTPDGFMPPPNLPPPMGSNPSPSSASSTHSSSAAPYHYGQQQPPVMHGGHPNNPYYLPPYHHQETCSIM